MPNWCYTDIEFRGKDAVKFWEMLERARERSCKIVQGGDFGEYWLGHYLVGSGVPEEDAVHSSHAWYDCRGTIDKDSIDDAVQGDIVCIKTETAWSPKVGMFRHLVDLTGLDVTVHYYGEESDNGVYVASDRSMTEGADYIVDSCINEYKLPEIEDEKVRAVCEALSEPGFYINRQLKGVLEKLYGAPPIKFSDLMDKFMEYLEDEDVFDEDDTYITIHRIKFDEPASKVA